MGIFRGRTGLSNANPGKGLSAHARLPDFASLHPGYKNRFIMIDVHYWTTPNGHKITIFLEEAGLDYKIFPVNIGKGEQFKAEFLTISPNNRIPAIVDHAPAVPGAAYAGVLDTKDSNARQGLKIR